jgi:cathepsin B
VDYCVTATEEGIKREILRNGPVAAVLPIYRDFLVYKKGIYEIIEGTSKFHGGHIVKIIGWGK